jgi:septal ring factor EnvC (AmiA/AmiB activator)
LQLELEEEKQRQAELLAERERQEAELLEKEQHYNSLQDEVAGCRTLIKKLRARYRAAQAELKDIHKENAEQNKDLLETVRQQAKELDFLTQITGCLMTDE